MFRTVVKDQTTDRMQLIIICCDSRVVRLCLKYRRDILHTFESEKSDWPGTFFPVIRIPLAYIIHSKFHADESPITNVLQQRQGGPRNPLDAFYA